MVIRNNMLRVRFSDEEWDALHDLCEEAGMTMSELVRNHLRNVTINNHSHVQSHTITLSRINANLNIIARWVNTHKNAADAVEVISHLVTIQQSIKGHEQ